MAYGAQPFDEKGAAPCGTAPSRDPSQVDAYAASLIFSAASATRVDSGCAASLASFSIASVFFDACAIHESNAERM